MKTKALEKKRKKKGSQEEDITMLSFLNIKINRNENFSTVHFNKIGHTRL